MPGKPCPLRKRSRCKDGGGKRSLCDHGRERSRCKDCGGSGLCEHGRERSRCKDCGGSGLCASTGGSTAIARSAAAAACASTDGSAGTARIAVAACGLMHPRACWISSATLVACVKYASVCASLGGRNSHGRRPARGRASFSGGEVDRGKWQFGARQRRFSRQKGSTSGRQGWGNFGQKRPH